MTGLVARQSVFIAAFPGRVWKALTDPESIRQYLFGTDAESDWKAGSPVMYRGVYQGRSYEDKGTVLRSPQRSKCGGKAFVPRALFSPA